MRILKEFKSKIIVYIANCTQVDPDFDAEEMLSKMAEVKMIYSNTTLKIKLHSKYDRNKAT